MPRAMELAKRLRGGFFDAVVGIGGGSTLDVAKYAATLTGLPMVVGRDHARARRHRVAGRVAGGATAARAPTACRCRSAIVVDLDYVRRSPREMRRSGIGDTVSNLGAVADWRLAERERGEPVDGARGHVRPHGRRWP